MKQVPVCVTRPVHDTKTIDVCHLVPKNVAYTVTRCVPKVVCREVACEPDSPAEPGCAAEPACGGDIRLTAFSIDPAPVRKILVQLGEPLEPPPLEPARGPPTSWDELVQVHDDRDATQPSPEDLPGIDIRSL